MGSVRKGTRGRHRRLFRATAACLGTLLGATGLVTIAATPAMAATSLITSSPSSPQTISTTVTLTWTISDPTGLDCDLVDASNNTVAGPAACAATASYDVAAPGQYTLELRDSGDSSMMGASDPVEVVPVAPPITSAPTTPFNDKTPTWQFSLLSGATAVCTLEYGGSVVLTKTGCKSPYSPDVTKSTTHGSDGVYTLHITQTLGGETSADTTSDYDYETAKPATPGVTADATVGNDRHPTFTVTGLDPAATPVCKVVPSAVVQSCGSSTTVNLIGHSDGPYQLHVTQVYAGNVSAEDSAVYTLDTIVHQPTLSADADFGADAAPSFSVGDLDADATLECSVNGPSNATVSQCDTSTILDLTGAAAGAYTVKVDAKDAAGNVSPTSKATYEYLPGPPPAPSVVAHQAVGSDSSPRFTITDPQATTLTYSCTVTAATTNASLTVPAPVCGPNTTLDLSGAPDDVYTLSVTATDLLGQTSPAGTGTYTFDTTTAKPTVSLLDPATSPGIDPSPTFTITDSELGDTFHCTWVAPGGVTILDATCASGQVFGTKGHGNGPYTLTVTATDTVGNSATADPVTYLLERSAPPAPTVTVLGGDAGTSSTPSFAVVESENVPVTYLCSVSPRPAGVSVTSCGPTTNLNLGSAPDGAYTVSVRVKDGLGHLSPKGSATYTLDTVAQAPTVNLSAPLVSPSSNTSPQFTIVDQELVSGPDTFTCEWDAPNGTPLSTAPCVSGDAFSATVDGTYTLNVAATDQLGNVSTTVGSTTYTLDRSAPDPPTVTLSSPATSPGNVTSPQFTVTDPDTSPGGVTFVCSVTGKTTVPAAAISCGPTTTVDLSGAGRDGTYVLSVTAVDASGNSSLIDGTASYSLDTTRPGPPTVTLSSPPTSPSNVTSATFGVTSPGDVSPGGVTYTCTVIRTAPAPVVPVNAADITCGPSTSIAFGNTGDGTYKVSVLATDKAGNTGTAAGTATYVLDTGAPPAPVIVVPGPSALLPVFGISDSDPTATLTCLLVSPRARIVFPTGPDATCPADGTFDTTAYSDGDYTLTVTATDRAGNTSSSTATWTRDTTAPPAPTVTPPPSPSNDTTPTFAIDDLEPTAILTCVMTGPDSSSLVAFTGTCPTDGTFTLPADGLYTLTVTASDLAHNAQASTASAVYTLDTGIPAAPTVTRTSPVGSPNNVSVVRFGVVDPDTSPGGLTLSCTVAGPTPVPDTDVSCGAVTMVDLTGAGRDGTYTLTVVARDAAGNVSPAGIGTYTLDTVAPPVPSAALTAPAQSPGNLTLPVFGVTDAESSPGLTFTCSVTGVTVVPASAVTCGPTTTVDLSGAGRDGDYVLSVTATDAAGNVSAAGTAAYSLDTVAPFAPVVSLASSTRSNDPSPLWTWQFGVNDTATDLDTATCIVTGPRGWTLTTPGCHRHYAPALGGGDGIYTVTVVLTDEAGNAASQVSPQYNLDSSAPAGAAVTLRHPGFVGLSRHPVWKIVGPASNTFECTLLKGGPNGTPLAPESECPDPATFSLVGEPDGMYTLSVIAVDTAHNSSFAAYASYILAPSAPQVHAPKGNGTLAVWTVQGNPDDQFSCTLLRNGNTVAGPHRCGARPRYDMSHRPSDTYVLSVVQIGAQGATSVPGTASWFWAGHVPTNPGTDQTNGDNTTDSTPPPGGGGHKPPHKTVSPADQLPSNTRQVVERVKREVDGFFPPFHHPDVHPNRVTDHITSAVQNAVHTVGSAGGGTGFPLLLVGLVLAFLVAQNRIDRRDPKLALASIAADDMVEFGQPPSRRERP